MGTKVTAYIFVAYFLLYFIGKAMGHWGKNLKHPPPTPEDLQRRKEESKRWAEELDKRDKEGQQKLREDYDRRWPRNSDKGDLPF